MQCSRGHAAIRIRLYDDKKPVQWFALKENIFLSINCFSLQAFSLIIQSGSVNCLGPRKARHPTTSGGWGSSSPSYIQWIENVSQHHRWYCAVLQYTSLCLSHWLWCKVSNFCLYLKILNIFSCYILLTCWIVFLEPCSQNCMPLPLPEMVWYSDFAADGWNN